MGQVALREGKRPQASSHEPVYLCELSVCGMVCGIRILNGKEFLGLSVDCVGFSDYLVTESPSSLSLTRTIVWRKEKNEDTASNVFRVVLDTYESIYKCEPEREME